MGQCESCVMGITEFLCHAERMICAGQRRIEQHAPNRTNCSHFSSLQVVNRIREVPHRTRLLVVDRDTDDVLRSRGKACTEDIAVEMGTLSPRPSPAPTPSASPIPRGTSPLSPKVNNTRSSAADVTTDGVTSDEVKRSSEILSAATDTEVRVGVRLLFGAIRRMWQNGKIIIMICA